MNNLGHILWNRLAMYIVIRVSLPDLSLSALSRSFTGTKIPPPTNIQLFFINISAVHITWEYPSGDDPLPILFQLRVSQDGSTFVDASDLISKRLFVYNGMLHSSYYQFQVLAYFEDVVSLPAETESFENGITGEV